MKQRPILMSAPMVRAILAGTKTQTRRAVAFPRKRDAFVVQDYGNGWWPYQSDDGESAVCNDGCEHPYASPYGVPGDQLYVKEQHEFIAAPGGRLGCLYRADMAERVLDAPAHFRPVNRGRPSIYMPRWASRITLEVTDVRVERLNDISEADAIAEGADAIEVGGEDGVAPSDWSHRCGFMQLWDSINGAGSWATNPWVWAITFRRIDSDAEGKR